MAPAELLRTARTGAGLSQNELARRAGVAQSVISAYERGHRKPSLETLLRLVAATGGTLRVDVATGRRSGLPDSPLGRRLRRRRRRVLDIAARYGVTNVRVFGSVARGEDGPDSDVDLLADLPPGITLVRLARLREELSAALGARVDVGSADGLKERVRDEVLREAIPL